ncbi:hypothetical protein [[Phormidium] sp. ETS-05]|uniref:hypothetical protein n=1 Tax=[Phormidium] sp. ETS-05 TaxID=222819 RepID=UPI0018EEF5B9|nr:hypothetical protein [[Phormidium] sp. ETS-05]
MSRNRVSCTGEACRTRGLGFDPNIDTGMLRPYSVKNPKLEAVTRFQNLRLGARNRVS